MPYTSVADPLGIGSQPIQKEAIALLGFIDLFIRPSATVEKLATLARIEQISGQIQKNGQTLDASVPQLFTRCKN